MTQQQFETRKERAANGVFVISQTEDGYRVYSPAYPTKSYIVSGSPEAPRCTCLDFEHHQGDPEWHCKHILAVLEHVAKPDSCVPQTSSVEDQERAAIAVEGNGRPKRKRLTTPANSAPHMLIKRSASPDGRIDSLSVEFSYPVDGAPAEEIKFQAERILTLQSEVIASFLSRNGKSAEAPPSRTPQNGAVPARMVNIAGMNGKWGRRLFINVQVNGGMLKLFGNPKELAEVISMIGFPDFARRITEGARLNLPCMVITKPSDDGRFTNIERVLPEPMPVPQPQRGWRQ